jgi:hypothetical protein
VSVFIPEIGFRSSDGLMLARPVTVTKDDNRGLRVMRLAATDAGTELAFQVRHPQLEAACATGRVDYRARLGEFRLRDGTGAQVPQVPGPGNGSSFGSNGFGAFGRKVVFAPIATEVVTLEVRGELGDWDVPLELVPIADGPVVPATPIAAADARNGVTVRVAAMAETEDRMVLDVRAEAGIPVKAIEIGGWVLDGGHDGFALIDEGGGRIQELSMRERMEMRRLSGSTVVAFPRIKSRSLTLVVPAIVVQEAEGTLELDLPIYAPTDLIFGRHPVRIRYAGAVDALATVPGEAARPGLEIQFAIATWRDDRRVMLPGPVFVDGSHVEWSVTGRAEAGAMSLNIPMAHAASARKVTMHEPVIAVRGPWQIPFQRPR